MFPLITIKAVDNTSTVDEIIKQCYYEECQSLRLFHLPKKWQEVLNQRTWKMIKSLDLAYCDVNDQSISQIFKHQWPNLQTLNLKSSSELSNITEKGIKQLTNYEWNELKKLVLNDNKINDIGFEQLMEKLGQKLIQLSVDNNNISYLGLRIFTKSSADNLKILSLNKNKIGLKGVQLLVKANFELQKLSLRECELCNLSMVTIIKKSHWPALESIQLDYNKIGLDGFCSVYENNWKHLQQLRNVQQSERPSLILMQLTLSQWKQTELSILRQNSKTKIYKEMKSIMRAKFNGNKYDD